MCFSNNLITHSPCYEMEQVNYFKDLFESMPEYREIVKSVCNSKR